MSVPVELLAAAGAAIAGSMGTDIYQYVRGSLSEIVGRRSANTEGESAELQRLDTLAHAVASVPVDQRSMIAEGVQVPIERLLGEFIVDDNQIAALRDLVDVINDRLTEASPTVTQQNVTGNFAGGNINTAGRDNNFGGMHG